MSEVTKFFIRDALVGDLKAIVKIHRNAFPGFLMTMLGPRFLHEYYGAVLEYPGRILLVAINSDGAFCGFVAGFSKPSDFYRHFNTRKKKVMLSAALHVAVRPNLWRRVIENMRKVDSRSSSAESENVKTAELASVAVVPDMPRRGCGKQLVIAFLERAKDMSIREVELTTDAVGNDAVNVFYQGLGFSVSKKFARVDGRQMNQFEYKIE